MPTLKRQSLSDQLYDELRTNIINLTFPLGSRLNVNELQTVYQVSCTPIREAISRLQAEGLVVYESNVGARVISLTPEDVIEIHDLALTLHSAAVRFSMQRCPHEHLADEIKKYLTAYENARSIDALVKSAHHLIGVFYHNCNNSRLDRNMKSLHGEQLILRYLHANHTGMEQKNEEDYRRIYEAVLQSDPEAVIGILTENYRRAAPIAIEALLKLEAAK